MGDAPNDENLSYGLPFGSVSDFSSTRLISENEQYGFPYMSTVSWSRVSVPLSLSRGELGGTGLLTDGRDNLRAFSSGWLCMHS